MTNILVKKISFSTYVKFAALLGASIALFFIATFILMFPIVLLSSLGESPSMILPMYIISLFFLPAFAFVFGMYGVISYPFYLLVCKVLKKFTLEVELIPVEEEVQPIEQNVLLENDVDISEDETSNITQE